MRSKTIINSKGEPQATRIEIPIKGAGGALGMQAVTKLTALISGLKNKKQSMTYSSSFTRFKATLCAVVTVDFWNMKAQTTY